MTQQESKSMSKIPAENAIEVIRPASAGTRVPQVISVVAAEVDAETSIDFAGLIRRYAWLMAALLILGCAGGFVSVILATPMYRSRLLLEIQPSRTSMRQGAGSGEAQDEATLQTQMLMMRSGGFLKRVVGRMQTETLPVAPVRNDFFTKLRTKLRPEMRNSAQILEDGIQSAAENLQVRVVNGTTLLEITSESIHPEVAANFVNTVGSEFIDQSLQVRAIDAQRTGQWLAAQVEETKLKLHEAEEKLQSFVRSSGNLFVLPESTLADSSLQQFQGALNSAKTERIVKQSKYERIVRSRPEDVVDLLENEALRTQQAKLNEFRQQRAVLLLKYTASHPKVQQLDLQIRETEQVLRKETLTAVERIKADYEAAVRSEKLLGSAHAGAAGQVSSQAGQAAQYAALKREVDILRQTYSQILVQASETGIENALPQNNLRVVDAAQAAAEPLKPKPILNISMGGFLGLALCGGLVFLRERMDRSLKNPGSARELLNLPELGVIPSLEASEPMPRNFRVRISLKSKSLMSKALRMGAGARELIAWQQHSFFAESFRHVMASLMRQGESNWKSKAILVSSPNPSEGKTMVTSNLGVCLAETGRRTLIVDADFRRPRVHSMFGIPNEKGLGQALAHTEGAAWDLAEVGIQSTKYPNLDVLVNGPEIADLARVLYSNNFASLLGELEKAYDIVLIDAPPVLQIVDSRIMGKIADGMVLVLRSGKTDRKSALDAYRCLREDGTRILGTVLNDWRPTRKKTDDYYGYVRSQASNGLSAEFRSKVRVN
jgi:polysaccharide biosynthesis transport protein